MSLGGQGQYDEMAQLASMHMMMGIMKSCFGDCINDFKTNDLGQNEKNCLQNCAKRMAGTYEVVAQAQQQMGARGGMGQF
ncbi:UNKNOWN [Stylonychia lemnae]|uniref:Mitochondrial import inner membrane translocase subunit n=1 Tax=Stylonychia lemnae TaxID=5949 RepID=A0A078AD83_STYLE|nr:UNKNOWN [Stylonychia lemnae]|eukprot:CDW79801.1 UNKNOWN [Stylonychia lemnae]